MPVAYQVHQPAAVVAQASPQTRSGPAQHQVYVVQDGDTLWSISQHFYGNGFGWDQIYHANSAQLSDPNVIYVGQQLVIPGASSPASGTTMAQPSATPDAASAQPVVQSSPQPVVKTAPASASLPGVPATAAYYINQAANALHLPPRIVAEQNYVESGWGTDLGPSSAGAQGPWQFEPYSWPSYSSLPFASANQWGPATAAYIRMMSQLLQQFHGSIPMALAAYNAGPGNWPAGLGYADTILRLAGVR